VLRGKQNLPTNTFVPPQQPTVESKPQVALSQSETAEELQPRTGVEVLSPEERQGKTYYTMRDLRNNNVVNNVTRASARRLWHYAITAYSSLPADIDHSGIIWQGNLGLIKKHRQGKILHYDLVLRTPQGPRFFFGVTEDGIHGPWKTLVGEEEA
jgi:hypothetical protein